MGTKYSRPVDQTSHDPVLGGQERHAPNIAGQFTEEAEAQMQAAEVEADHRRFISDEEVSELRALLRQ